MWSVRTIPPNNLVPTQLKVAAYCRVSTNSLEQQTSLSSQEQYYEEWIKRIPHWTFAGIYSDIGSGTQAKGRRRFNAMISACRRGKIDTILTKSAHRFARNTVDALETIRMLRRWKVDIYFEIEGIHSLYESSEFLLAVVCARAQEESYSKSEDIKWGLRKAFENPESRYYQRICYGYTHNKDGRLVINEKEAQIVRLIYEMAGEGKSLSRISSRLKEMGIPSPRGKETWSRETLRKILKNEKYTGSVILQKTYVKNFLEHKSLILEHHMAASRFGFLELYLPLNEVPVFNTSLRDGSISELSFLSKVISPLVQAYKGNNDFEVLKIVKEYSPLMESKKWISLDDQTKALQQVESAVDKLMELWKDDAIPTCLDVLRSIQDTGLFKLDERVDNILSSPAADESIRITALRKALSVPFTTLEKYFAYVSDNTRFATHQGVKGLEFPRVMVIIDDAEAKGFLFSYEKLFGVKLKTETDIKNEREGKDNSITRTTRLFYVACTRAQKSLAIIAYTYDCEAVKATAMKNNWFEDDEIRLLE